MMMINQNKLCSLTHLKPLRIIFIIAFSLISTLLLPNLVYALEDPVNPDIEMALNTLWVIFSGCLVFLMNIGFLTLENGFTPLDRGININVISKNLIVFPIVVTAFSLFGFSIMFSDGGQLNGLMGHTGLFFSDSMIEYNIKEIYSIWYPSLEDYSIPLLTMFFFQLTFASTTATIVSGALIGRIRFTAFCLFSFVLAAAIYPICGHLVWGGGSLADNFSDFAGSTVVHSVGGWAALSGAFILGPRNHTEVSQRMKLESAAMGCLILWIGWLGFNAGSTFELDAEIISHIIVVTILAGGVGSLSAFFWYWFFSGKQPSLSFIINGILGGCVSITASCRYVTPTSAMVIGLIGGMVVVAADKALLSWKKSELINGKIRHSLVIDDPVGAIPVHLCCGIWGTWAVGLFAEGPGSQPSYDELDGPVRGVVIGLVRNVQENKALPFEPQAWALLRDQIIGTIVIAFVAYLLSYTTWKLLDFLYRDVFGPLKKPSVANPTPFSYGIRVSPWEEESGIDAIFKEYNAYSSLDDINELVKELQRILEDVVSRNHTDTEEQKQKASEQALEAIRYNDELREKLSLVLSSVRKEILIDAIDNPLLDIVLARIENEIKGTYIKENNIEGNIDYIQ